MNPGQSTPAKDLTLKALEPLANSLLCESNSRSLVLLRSSSCHRRVSHITIKDLIAEQLLRNGHHLGYQQQIAKLAVKDSRVFVQREDGVEQTIDDFARFVGLPTWRELRLYYRAARRSPLKEGKEMTLLCIEYWRRVTARQLWTASGVWHVESFFDGEDEKWLVKVPPEADIQALRVLHPILAGVKIEQSSEVH